MPAAELTIPELFVEQLYDVPGIRMFARRADALWRSTQILDRAWDRAVETVRASGQSLREMFPDWEATAVRWSAFVDDTRDFIRDALRWFRAYAQGAIEHINSLIRELDEWLGFTAMWSEMREWVLRELRSFRSGPTLSERLDRTEQAAGSTLALLAAGTLAGLGAWAYYEWRKANATRDLIERLGDRA